VIEVSEKSKSHLRVKAAVEASLAVGCLSGLKLMQKRLKVLSKHLPQRSELPASINESFVVELYSK
jgi:small subunit ribosomal protein S4